jgi:WD40 repeat protein
MLKQEPGFVGAVAWSPDGRLAAASNYAGEINIFQTSDWAVVSTLAGHQSGVTEVAWSPDGQHIASASADSTTRIWRSTDYSLLQTLVAENPQTVTGVVWSPESDLLAATDWGGMTYLWDAVGGTQQMAFELPNPGGIAFDVQYSPDGNIVTNGHVLWQATDGRIIRSVPNPDYATSRGAAWTSDGATLITSYDDGTIWVWDVDMTF